MVDYLTSFASILNHFFKSLTECGLMGSYAVQLQSKMACNETTTKFKILVQHLIKDLQNLLSSIPNVQCSEASTQTIEDTTELVEISHPSSVAQFTNVQVCSEENRKSAETCNLEQATPSVVSSVEICQLKPLLIGTHKGISGLVNLQTVTNLESTTVKVDKIVHLVVETTDRGTEQTIVETQATRRSTDQLICKVCDMKFETQADYQGHMKDCHCRDVNMQMNNIVQTCDMCDKVFNSTQSLQEHCRSNHNGTGCFKCSACGKRFMTKLSLNRHTIIHEGKKEAVCNVCGKAFSRPDYLLTHYSSHNGKRTFACSQCPRKFVRGVHLRAHEKVHSGVKDFICKVCKKEFARSDKLKEHMLRHLNIKRFQCSTCKREYAENRDLKKHLKTHKNFNVKGNN